MTALVGYTVSAVVLSQRHVPPLLLFVAAVGVFSANGSGPLPPTYAACAGALLVCVTWLTMAVDSVEEPVHRALAVVASGDARKVGLATVLTALLGVAVMTAIGLGLPAAFGTTAVTAVDLVVGGLGQLVGGVVGVAVGLLCSRTVIPRRGAAFVVALGLVLIVLLTPGLPPVHTALQLMALARESSALLAPLGALLALALAVLAAAAVAVHLVAVRRD